MNKIIILVFLTAIAVFADPFLVTSEVSYTPGTLPNGLSPHPGELYAEYTLVQYFGQHPYASVTKNSDENPEVFGENWYTNETGMTSADLNQMGLNPAGYLTELLSGYYEVPTTGEQVSIGSIQITGRTLAGGNQYLGAFTLDWATPVEGMAIEAVSMDRAAKLIWRCRETDNAGFVINGDIEVPSKAVNSTRVVKYEYVVENLINGKEYFFTVQPKDIHGRLSAGMTIRVAPGVQAEMVKPDVFDLKQNYPNPFNPSTEITFDLYEPGWTSLKVYDVRGREIAALVDEYKEFSGVYTESFNAENYHLSSGIYFYVLNVNGVKSSRKMLLVK